MNSSREKEYIAKQAKEIADHFELLCPSKKEKGKSPYHLKVERFKERVRSGMVMVESIGHPLEGLWVQKHEVQSVIYTDPDVWLREKGIACFQ